LVIFSEEMRGNMTRGEPSGQSGEGMIPAEVVGVLAGVRAQVIDNVHRRNAMSAPDQTRIFFPEPMVDSTAFLLRFGFGEGTTTRLLKEIRFVESAGRFDHADPVEWRAGELRITTKIGLNKPKTEAHDVYCLRLTIDDIQRSGFADLSVQDAQLAEEMLSAGAEIWVVRLENKSRGVGFKSPSGRLVSLTTELFERKKRPKNRAEE
jgi:hypothetical protein